MSLLHAQMMEINCMGICPFLHLKLQLLGLWGQLLILSTVLYIESSPSYLIHLECIGSFSANPWCYLLSF